MIGQSMAGRQRIITFPHWQQIKRGNVQRLEVAWTYDTEESGGLQTSPIEVEGVLYGLTPSQKVFAVDAATGKLLWKFDSGVAGTQPDRGLAYWSDRNKNDKSDSRRSDELRLRTGRRDGQGHCQFRKQ